MSTQEPIQGKANDAPQGPAPVSSYSQDDAALQDRIQRALGSVRTPTIKRAKESIFRKMSMDCDRPSYFN